MSLHDANDTLKDVVVPLVSAVIGAITGAAAAYWPASRLATRASDEVLKRDAAARRDEELRSARQVFIKGPIYLASHPFDALASPG